MFFPPVRSRYLRDYRFSHLKNHFHVETGFVFIWALLWVKVKAGGPLLTTAPPTAFHAH